MYYYYMGNLEKAKYFHKKFVEKNSEPKDSQMKKYCLSALKHKEKYASQRIPDISRFLSINTEEEITAFHIDFLPEEMYNID